MGTNDDMRSKKLAAYPERLLLTGMRSLGLSLVPNPIDRLSVREASPAAAGLYVYIVLRGLKETDEPVSACIR